MGFLTGARKFANEFGEGFQEGFEQRQQYHENKQAPAPAPENVDPDQLLRQHINDLVINKAKNGFNINTDEAQENLPNLINNKEFLHDIEADERIAKYRVQLDPQLAKEGNQVIDAVRKGVPISQFNTEQQGLAMGARKNNIINAIQDEKNELVRGMHPNGIKYQNDLDDLRFNSDYQRLNMENSDVLNRADNIRNVVMRGDLALEDLDIADQKIALLRDRDIQANQIAQRIRKKDLSKEEFNTLDPKLGEAAISQFIKDDTDMKQMGMEMWNSRNPEDQVGLEEFSRRRDFNEEEGRRMAADRMVGAGQFGFVFEGDRPNVLIKQEAPVSAVWNSGVGPGTGVAEVNNLSELQGAPGVPKMFGAEMLNDGTTRLEIEDLRDNYVNYRDKFGNTELDQATDIKRAQQEGGFNLRGMEIADRHEGNVMVHELTGRPMQVDFGIGQQLNNSRSKAIALGNNTRKGFLAAGLEDEGDLLGGLVGDLIKEGRDDEAYKMAKQGFAQLQKIKKPVNAKRASQFF